MSGFRAGTPYPEFARPARASFGRRGNKKEVKQMKKHNKKRVHHLTAEEEEEFNRFLDNCRLTDFLDVQEYFANIFGLKGWFKSLTNFSMSFQFLLYILTSDNPHAIRIRETRADEIKEFFDRLCEAPSYAELEELQESIKLTNEAILKKDWKTVIDSMISLVPARKE
jgi:hypothetical protein